MCAHHARQAARRGARQTQTARAAGLVNTVRAINTINATANPANTARAFTLLELLIALAIAAVIAAFAFASYRSQIARGHRTDATAAIYRAAQFVDAQTPDIATLPAGLDQSPQSGVAVYRLRLSSVDESSGGYAIEASPVETGPMHDDPCGTFVLDATGRRSNRPIDEAAPPRADECWGGR